MAAVAHDLGAMMGASTSPLSPLSQQLNEAESATANTAGDAIFTFQSPPGGTTWTGTVTCAGAPTSAVFVAAIGGTSWGDWGGNSVAGPIQCFGSGAQQLIVNAQGLTPGVDYLLEWTGSSDPSYLVAPVWPDVNTSAQAILSGEPTLIVPPFLSSANNTTFTLTPPANARTLYLMFQQTGMGAGPFTNILVYNQWDIPFYNQPPYLRAPAAFAFASYVCVIPLINVSFPLIGQPNTAQLTIEMVGGGTAAGEWNIEIYADTALVPESTFYTGVAQAAAAGGAGTLVNGPCRLVSAYLYGNSANLQVNGADILQNTQSVPITLSWSPGIIVPVGSSAVLIGAAVAGGVGYCYP